MESLHGDTSGRVGRPQRPKKQPGSPSRDCRSANEPKASAAAKPGIPPSPAHEKQAAALQERRAPAANSGAPAQTAAFQEKWRKNAETARAAAGEPLH